MSLFKNAAGLATVLSTVTATYLGFAYETDGQGLHPALCLVLVLINFIGLGLVINDPED
jgi:hypothetical protein